MYVCGGGGGGGVGVMVCVCARVWTRVIDCLTETGTRAYTLAARTTTGSKSVSHSEVRNHR